MNDPTMTESSICEAIKRKIHRRVWFEQMRIGVGYGENAERRIDLFGVAVEKSEQYARTAIEIKLSRSDFTREMRKPAKRQWVELHCNEHYFAAPEGMLKYDDLPYGWGLLEVGSYADGRLYITVKHDCLFMETGRPTWRFVASLARRIKEMEGAAK